MFNFPFLKFSLDLLRHGRNHNSGHPPRQIHAQPNNIPSRVDHQQEQATSVAPVNHTEPTYPPAQEAAVMIVNEERESRNSMPSYKGLENFKLLEKMGECADFTMHTASSNPRIP
jgi:hypothetical protein